MKVLLRKDIDGVGRRGDIVDVKSGYARNFLFPSGAALVASESLDAQSTSMRRSRDLKDARDHEAAVTQKDAIERSTITIPARAGAQGRLFGSIGPLDIATAITAATGVELDRHQVELEEHLKALGTAEVTVALFGDVRATASIEVVAQG